MKSIGKNNSYKFRNPPPLSISQRLVSLSFSPCVAKQFGWTDLWSTDNAWQLQIIQALSSPHSKPLHILSSLFQKQKEEAYRPHFLLFASLLAWPLTFNWELNGALSPVSHKGLHQGWTKTSLYLQAIHFTSHHVFCAYLYSEGTQHGNLLTAKWPILFCRPTQEPVLATANTGKNWEKFWKKCRWMDSKGRNKQGRKSWQ